MQTGLYKYSQRQPDGSFVRFRMHVEILAEYPRTYLVRFLKIHADGRQFGTTTKVRKGSVTVFDGCKSLQTKGDQARLPYKD